MGYLDREYQQYRSPANGFGARIAGCPMVKWLLIANIAVFFLDILLPTAGQFKSELSRWGVFSVEDGLVKGQVWRLFSFQFLHGGALHILFNMYALFMFGPILERWWRSAGFLAFYLLSGAAGALLFAVLEVTNVLPSATGGSVLLGASGGVFAILIGAAVIAPAGRIQLLFPPIAMSMKTFAIALLVFEVVMVMMRAGNAGGSAGHLGGALMGWLFFKVGPLKSWLMGLDGLGAGKGQKIVKTPKKRAPSYKAKIRPRPTNASNPGEVDRILDKINAEGLHSLTEDERKVLQEASKH